MRRVTAEGRGPVTHRVAKTAVRWAAARLLPDTSERLRIFVNFETEEEMNSAEDASECRRAGLVMTGLMSYDVTRNDTYYLTISSDLQPLNAISNIMHEMVHVAQMERGDLGRYTDEVFAKRVMWKGEKVEWGFRGLPPWEDEAETLENILTAEFLDESGIEV